MKKTIQSLAVVSMAIGLILTSCQTKTLVPDGNAIKGSGDSLKNLVHLIDCTLMKQVMANAAVPQNNPVNPDTVVIKGKGNTTMLLILPVYSRTYKLVEAYNLLKQENVSLQNKLMESAAGTKMIPVKNKR